MRFALIAALFLFASSAIAQQTDADALKLLDSVAQHYQDAERLHLEATEISSFHNEFANNDQRTVLSAYIAPGNRFRYEGHDQFGSGFIVSDGTNEWHLLASLAEYSRKPSGTFFASRRAITGDDSSLSGARNLIQRFAFLGTGLKSAHFGPDETLTFNGHEVHCKVVQYGLDDFDRKQQYNQTQDTSLWIDPASLNLLKEVISSSGRSGYGSQPAPFGRIRHFSTTTVYTTIDFDFQPKPDTFTLVPPLDTKEVADLPVPYPNQPGTPDPLAARDALAEKIVTEHLGKQLPEVSVRDGDLNEVKLSRYAGHPLLIDVWATWCAPCVSELAALNNIRKSTAGTDLKMIGIDEDDKLDTAPAFLQRRGYDWENFHATRDVMKALPNTGIPLIVLVDSSGKIVYYHIGMGDERNLTAAIAKLGKPYETVSTDK